MLIVVAVSGVPDCIVGEERTRTKLMAPSAVEPHPNSRTTVT
jgi:hypothetical protein